MIEQLATAGGGGTGDAGAITLERSSTAVVVVDMQNDFVAEGGSLRVPDAQATIPAIAGLLERARAAGARVIYTQDAHDEGDPEWEIWPEHARRGTWGQRIVSELEPRPGETVISKLRYDAFYGTELDHLLRLWGVRTLVICGTVANICVHYTAASAALRWYEVVLVKDGISALDPADMDASLRQAQMLFGARVADVSQLRFA
ncbi:MAG TPA: isochorismatase family cysteine hydrolase [Solirubrobacteraceae bacterium]|nr:isochorismatase family cysteine hydrolase [Solirubrobacteraceae bacterium]